MRVDVPGGSLDIDESYLDATPETVRQQVREYARGDRHTFDVGVRYPDDFTGQVMRAMAAIPHGETRTYGDIAAAVDSGAVAVGGGCGRNPIPLVVPCHRVVAADSIGGFSAAGGAELKQSLLEHEGALDTQTNLERF
ncbi:methylated-DNA--[protein]-cysteine S-methyltransferase [Halorarius litoreus]|uniref:methylated-DNA--[protein]-cysteine S-methyltransferase n=1 Tax=Halorarius litoreus TaxID=2962676 RepID=UPI0020CE5C30|nr:methylated-DNA--[protein]-cysteine S-methyltransferase [Halorarius litoreus]